MWKIINSPIVIAFILITAFFSYNQLRRYTAADEIRSVYDELISITEGAKNDIEKKKLVEEFVKEVGHQIKEGFGSFDSGEDKEKKARENKHYFEVRKLVKISEPVIAENKHFSQKSVLYKVTNGSQEYLDKVAHTIELHRGKELIEVREDWGNIKLAPGESKPYSYNIQNSESVIDLVVITVNEISIMQVAE